MTHTDTCTCGDSVHSHHDAEPGPCLEPGCPCRSYEEDGSA